MPVPDVNDPRPAYVQIADGLRDEIKNGRLPPPSRLPAQREMAERYGVAAETLRKALDVLAREGIVSAGSTRGTFVLKVPGEPEPSAEYQQLATELNRLADRLDALEARMGEAQGDHHGARE